MDEPFRFWVFMMIIVQECSCVILHTIWYLTRLCHHRGHLLELMLLCFYNMRGRTLTFLWTTHCLHNILFMSLSLFILLNPRMITDHSWHIISIHHYGFLPLINARPLKSILILICSTELMLETLFNFTKERFCGCVIGEISLVFLGLGEVGRSPSDEGACEVICHLSVLQSWLKFRVFGVDVGCFHGLRIGKRLLDLCFGSLLCNLLCFATFELFHNVSLHEGGGIFHVRCRVLALRS